MTYVVTIETEDGSLEESCRINGKRLACKVAKALATGVNLPDVVRYLVETTEGQTVAAYHVQRAR